MRMSSSGFVSVVVEGGDSIEELAGLLALQLTFFQSPMPVLGGCDGYLCKRLSAVIDYLLYFLFWQE